MTNVPAVCPECGATLDGDELCEAKFHALLALEATVGGAAGGLAHFLAVAAYGVQHPASMGFTVAAVVGLRAQLAEAVAQGLPVEEIRRRVRSQTRNASRIRRTSNAAVPRWPIRRWPLNVTNVLDRGAAGYRDAVREWAQAVVAATDTVQVEASA